MDYITIYLSTCNKSSYILPATIFLYKHFITSFKPKFKILGFSKPNLPDWENVDFICLSDKPQNISKWSIYLYDYFKTVKEENIFFALDDFFPIHYFNKYAYDYVIDYMNQNKNVGFCTVGLCPSADINRNEMDTIINETDNMFIYRRKKPIGYQVTLQPGIWNREYFCKLFNNKFTPWEMEITCSNIANQDKYYYNISSSRSEYNNQKCIMVFATCSSLSSKWNGISVLGLQHELILKLIDNNLLPKDNLLVGARNNYILFDYNKKVTKEEFYDFCKLRKLKWFEMYSNYYD